MKIHLYVNAIRCAASYIRARLPSSKVKAAVILGSGLSSAVPRLRNPVIIPYAKIPGFPHTTVSGHLGKLIVGKIGKLDVAVMQGRFHYYEGHSMESIALPVRALEYLGVKKLILTAAVGSMRQDIKPGHIVVIRDHLNFMGRNPLRGFHEEEFGDMFPDMGIAYDPDLRRMVLAVCRKRRIAVHEGVYAAVGGPSYETPAEIRALQRLGGDICGMSVVPETVVARQMGVDVLALGWISNMAAGLSKETLAHHDVLAMGQQVSAHLRVVIEDILRQF